MPKLTVDYEAPYVVMAGKPAKIRVKVTNNGAGPANGLTISSAQPEIVENLNDIPIEFAITGSSPTGEEGDYRPGEMTITFDTVPPNGGQVAGYWYLTTTRDGYFVDFDASLKHVSYAGVALDPLIDMANATLVPAVGGIVDWFGCTALDSIRAELWQNSALLATNALDSRGSYYFPDLEAGDYQLFLLDGLDNVIDSMDVTVLDGQPTAIITTAGFPNPDSDNDGLDDCWEIKYFGRLDDEEGDPEDDPDGDGIVNSEERHYGTNPKEEDTDADGLTDPEELALGTDPTDADTDGDGFINGEDDDPLGFVYTALGDSFSSGEGAGSYRGCNGNTNEETCTHNHDFWSDDDGDARNLCARSTRAYSTSTPGGDPKAALFETLEVTPTRQFFACSGARSQQVTDIPFPEDWNSETSTP